MREVAFGKRTCVPGKTSAASYVIGSGLSSSPCIRLNIFVGQPKQTSHENGKYNPQGSVVAVFCGTMPYEIALYRV